MGLVAMLRGMSLRRRIGCYGLVALALFGPMVGFIFYAWAVPLGDFAPVQPVPAIGPVLAPLAPIEQTDKHTCGFLAISAIYRAYGLNPLERRLRQRLGTDNTANLYDSSSTGTIHPDLYRAMTQDGFALTPLDVDAADVVQALERHLDGGHFALGLVQRRETGNLHWVALGGVQDGEVLICDSMKPAPYREPATEWLRDCALGILLVKPSNGAAQEPVWKLHWDGLLDSRAALRHVRPKEKFPCPLAADARGIPPERQAAP